MKNIFKKNQLMITALAIMIAIAGYLQFAGMELEDDYLASNTDKVSVDSSGVIRENLVAGELGDYVLDGTLDLSDEDLLTDIESLDSDGDVIVDNYLTDNMQQVNGSDASGAENQVAGAQPEQGEIPGEAVFTASKGVAILSEAKLLKEQTRAKNKETLLEIINSAGLTEAQKQDAVNTMVAMTEIAEKEAAAEILLEAKGFQGVVVSINGGAVDVVVNELSLDEVMRAQIEDIVHRKTDIAPQNIIISTVVPSGTNAQ